MGLDKYGDGNQYRNHFVTGPGSKDFDDCKSLVADDLMTERAGHALSGGDSVFFVTQKGMDFVALNSPPRPPAQKFTRSQKRYQAWLNSDCGLSFAEWLGVDVERAKYP
jgi:hypothetical protein